MRGCLEMRRLMSIDKSRVMMISCDPQQCMGCCRRLWAQAEISLGIKGGLVP